MPFPLNEPIKIVPLAFDFATIPTTPEFVVAVIGCVDVSPPVEPTYSFAPTEYEDVLTPVNTPEITTTPSVELLIVDCANPITGNVPIVFACDFVTCGFPLVLLNPET